MKRGFAGVIAVVGWLAIGGSLVMVGVGVTLFLFVRRKIREEERGGP